MDISAIAPGVNIAKNEGFKTVITISGVGYETNQNAIATPSVSYHLDGIFVASPYSLQTDFMDLERIEVLRGPQGTLFGQNSTGGAINVNYGCSINRFCVWVQKQILLLEIMDFRKFRASFNLPLGEEVGASSIDVDKQKRWIYGKFILGQDLDDANSLSMRVRLKYEPSDTF